MAYNRGKAFESKFKKDWLSTVPNSTIDRLYDSLSGYYKISNISDFIGYCKPNIFYLEVKSIEGNTFPLSNLTQYDKLIEKVGIPGVRTGVVIWFVSHSTILYVPVKTVKKLKENNVKSVNINKILTEDYRVFQIPSKIKNVYLDSDYSLMLKLEDGD